MTEQSFVEPGAGSTPAPAGWQAQKSAATRQLIIDAAIACFVQLGYARTTTTEIAKRARLSRGAMLHHFPSKIDIVKAAVDYLHAKRLRAFRKAMAQDPPGGDHIRQGVENYWAHVKHPLFVAFFELAVAARTDPELARILRPAQEAFEKEWERTCLELFPEWRGKGKRFDLAFDLSRYLLEGMALSFLTHKETKRDRRLLQYLVDKLHELVDAPE
ncbi:MAG: TetR/AcrR family transcriptional regulator [Steroidobacteraceae bacterium]|nr:TetR/AcrR family transcriptional regulator [Steroidobacteraceae bacterium]MDW8259227.1 TetR/AcrR family transcriptional regulator [Gammaproteobacteria bacterium]